MIKKNHFESDGAFIQEARERARNGQTFWSENWEHARDDLEFLSGDQWGDQIKNERQQENRPCITNNVLPTYVDQLIGDQRQNRPSIKISPVNIINKKIQNVKGTQDYDLSQLLTAIVRGIEYICDAESAYDIAFQSAVESGIGYLRLRTDYIADDSFEQDIIIEAITNQFSVVLDPNSKKQDFSDANWAFINDSMLKKEFEALYPDVAPEPISETEIQNNIWFNGKTVRVSEYFVREPITRDLALLSDGRTVYLDEIKNVIDELAQQGIKVERKRKSKTHRVIWYKICGNAILEGPVNLHCSMIPIFPVFGKSITIDNKTIYRSLIRYAKDAQRMQNYWDSAAIETVGLAPKAPFIGSEEHVEGREREWQTANTTNRAILIYKPAYDGDQGPRRAQPAITPSAEIAMSLQMTSKIKSTIGMFDASLGASSNETSGKAIIARQRQGDRGTYAFMDNLNKSIKALGRCLVELLPVVYDSERIARLSFPDQTHDFVMLNQQVYDEQTGEWITINDLNVGKCDIRVTSGPSFTTQRIEAAEAMMQFAQYVPNAAAVIGDLIAQNMDWANADIISERLKKALPPEMLSQDERENIQKQAPQQQPDPQQQMMMQLEQSKIQAELARFQADQAKAQTEIQLSQIKLQEAQSNAGSQQNALSAIDIAKSEAEIARANAIKVKANSDTQIAEIRLQEAKANALAKGQDVENIPDAKIENPENLREEVRNYTAQAIAEYMQEMEAEQRLMQQQQNSMPVEQIPKIQEQNIIPKEIPQQEVQPQQTQLPPEQI